MNKKPVITVKGQTVTLDYGRRYGEMRVIARLNGTLEIRAERGGLVIRPNVSNVVFVRQERLR